MTYFSIKQLTDLLKLWYLMKHYLTDTFALSELDKTVYYTKDVCTVGINGLNDYLQQIDAFNH